MSKNELTISELRSMVAVTPQQAAKLTNMGYQFIANEIKSGRLPGFNKGNRGEIFISMNCLIDWVDTLSKERAHIGI